MNHDKVVLDNGRIVLLQGDCLEWLPKVKQSSVDLAVYDPPYFNVIKDAWDRQWATKDDYIAWCRMWLSTTLPSLKDSASLYCWGGVGEKSDALIHLKIAFDQFLYFKDWITWQKSRGMGNRRGWMYTREECLWYVKDNARFVWNELAQYDETQPTNRKDNGFNGKPRKSQFKRYTNVWANNDDQNYGVDRVWDHFTPKPLPLISRIVAAHTLNTSDVVLDAFMGSGTTGVACTKLNRRFIGIEKDQRYFEIAVRRIQEALHDQAR